MLITFRSGPVVVTLWDPEAKQLFSDKCRPQCILCRGLVAIMKLATRLHHTHLTKKR